MVVGGYLAVGDRWLLVACWLAVFGLVGGWPFGGVAAPIGVWFLNIDTDGQVLQNIYTFPFGGSFVFLMQLH